MQHCHREAEFDKFMKWRANSPAELAADSSLRNMSYSNRVLKFWAAQGSTIYPALASVARTFLVTNATEASCERVFSLAKNIIGMHRHNLDASMLDMLVHIKANMTKLLVEDPDDPKYGEVDIAQKKRLEEYVRHRDDQIRKDPSTLTVIPENTTFWMDA